MMRYHPGVIKVLFISGLMGIQPLPGWSFLATGCPCGVVAGQHSETRAHVTQETTTAAREIIEGLRAQTRQLSDFLDRQVEAAKRITDAKAQIETQRLREEIRARAESGAFDPNPDSCLQYDMHNARTVLTVPMSVDQLVAPVEDWTSGTAAPVRTGGTRMAAWLRKERAQLADFGGHATPTTDWGVALDVPSLPTSSAGLDRVLSRLIANTIDPLPPAALTEDELRTPVGLSQSVLRDARAARLQAALALIEQSLELRIPTTDAGPYRVVAETSGYAEAIPDQISELQKLGIRVTHYADPGIATLDLRQTKTVNALLQDLIDITAINARINLERLELASRQAIVEAAQLAIFTDEHTGE